MDALQPLIDLLRDPLAPAFMQRVMLAVVLVGSVCGLVGAFVVTRGMAFLGDALAHSILPGVALSYLTTNGSPQAVLLGGVAAGIISAVLISTLTRGARLSQDTAIGIVFAGALALGIAIISLSRDFSTDLQHLLIGNLLAVGSDDLLLMLALGLAVTLCIVMLYKELLAIAFDTTFSEAIQLPVQTLNTFLLVLVAMTVVIALQAVGITLVAAMLVIPAATARYYVKRLHLVMLVGALLGSIGGVAGVYISWYSQIAPSAAIVLTLTAFFLLTLLFMPTVERVRRARPRAVAHVHDS